MSRQLYEKVHEEWKNQPDKTTPVLAKDLEHIEQGIYDNSENKALRKIYGDKNINLGNANNIPETGNENFALIGNQNSCTGGEEYLAVGNANSIGGASNGCFGNSNTVEGSSNLVSGQNNTANEGYGSALGLGLIARTNQHVTGRYNIDDVERKYAEIVGNGNSGQRSNAYMLDWNGNAMFAGDVKTESGASLNGIGTPETLDIDFSNYFI